MSENAGNYSSAVELYKLQDEQFQTKFLKQKKLALTVRERLKTLEKQLYFEEGFKEGTPGFKDLSVS